MFDRVSPMGISIGRQAQLHNLQGDLARLTAEMASGRKSDPARELGVGASLLYKLYDDIQAGEAIQNATSLASKRLDGMQAALTSVGKLMDQMSPEILKIDALKGNGFQIIAQNAREVLGSMTDLLNMSWDGQSLFGGTDSAGPPLKDSAGLLAWAKESLTREISSQGRPLGAEAAELLADKFADLFGKPERDGSPVVSDGVTPLPASFYGLVYQSQSRTTSAGLAADESDAPSQVRIGAGETLRYNVRADNDTFKKAFESLALLSVLDAPEAQMSEEAKTAVLDRAGTLMRGARADLTVLAGTLGGKQKRLEDVAEIQARAISAAAAQINNLEATDYYTVSDRINTLQIQLQATYSITAKLSELSFVNYLR